MNRYLKAGMKLQAQRAIVHAGREKPVDYLPVIVL
jgi:hypothetical protein